MMIAQAISTYVTNQLLIAAAVGMLATNAFGQATSPVATPPSAEAATETTPDTSHLTALDPDMASTLAKQKPVETRHAMVVSVHHLASDAGVEILKKGGNAVDAAVATGFALAVVYPDAGNIGGGGLMLIQMKGTANAGPSKLPKPVFIDYREKAPMAATANMFLDAKGNVIPNASTVGYLAVGVPGSVAGMAYAEKKYGKLTLAQVMAPAIRLATEGYVLGEDEARLLRDKGLTPFAESKRIFQRNGDFYKAGETFKQPDLARTLKRIAADPDDFYHGQLAKEIAAAVKKGGGLITEADLAAYEVKERDPIVGSYMGYTIISAPPPSSGGIALVETLNILEGYGLSKLGDRTSAEMHLITEAFRRAYMDRNQYLGDPDFVNVPVDQFISKKYAAAWRSSIKADRASDSGLLQRPEGFLPPPPDAKPAPVESSQTTHYSIIDGHGNAVSVTTTLNDSFGSGATAEGLGFLLNNEMDDFSAKPGAANMYGLIEGPNNAIAGGKRPLSSMTPTIVLKGNKVRMVLGSPGGSRIPTTVANILLSVIDGGLNVQQAVDAPRFHHQFEPDTLLLEPGFASATRDGLRKMGYKVTVSRSRWSDGECIFVDPVTGTLQGGQDQRSHFGKAAGY